MYNFLHKNDLEKRIGYFEISEGLSYEDILEIFKQNDIFVIKADYLIVSRTIRYLAISRFFDKIKNGDVIPYYRVVINKENKDINTRMEKDECKNYLYY